MTKLVDDFDLVYVPLLSYGMTGVRPLLPNNSADYFIGLNEIKIIT